MGIELVLSLLDGLALFVYGMQMMSTNLEAVAGNRMKQILERLTANRFLGVLVGVGTTVLTRSPSVTAAMTVRFVNSGPVTLKRTVWIIMGASIDTAITGQPVVLDIGALALLIALVSVMFLIFAKNKKVQHVGDVIANIDILFIGTGMMSDTMVPLRDSEAFIHTVAKLSDPLLGILVRAVFATIIQSSSASVGILQALTMGGVINLHSAVFAPFDQNIGTCITVLLASVGTSHSAKYTTLIHLMLNVIDTALSVTLCILTPFIDFVTSLTPDNPMVQITNVHTISNISTTLILLLFGAFLEKIVIAVLPDKAAPVKDTDQWFGGLMASKHHPGISTIVTNQVHDGIGGMLAAAAESVSQSLKAVEEEASEGIRVITDREEGIDLSSVKLSQKTSKILVSDQIPKDIDTLSRTYTVLGNIKRIGDHVMSPVGYIETIEAKGLQFSSYVKKGFAVIEEIYQEDMELLKAAVVEDTQSLLSEVAKVEQGVDDITRKFRQSQIDHMREGNCNAEFSILYSEMLTDYERIGDYMLNIAWAYDAVEWSEDRGQTTAAIA